jgi:Leucine-rich repeat (LRR) protein
MKIIALACFLILNTLFSDGQDLSAYEGFRKYKSVRLRNKHFDSVKYLDLSYKKLSEVPLFIRHLKNLKVLNLSGNRLTFKEDVMLPQSIEVLILNNNNLNTIPLFTQTT